MIPTKLDQENLKASLDKFKPKLSERGYKLGEIKGSSLEALKFERKELIAERPKNKPTPLVYTGEYNLHLQNLRKALPKAGTE